MYEPLSITPAQSTRDMSRKHRQHETPLVAETPAIPKWRQWLDAFAESTYFHGVDQIIVSISWTEQILWIFLVLSAAALTIKSAAKNISDYVGQTTPTSVNAMVNTSISFPNATVCVGLFEADWNWLGRQVYQEKFIGGLAGFETDATQTRTFLEQSIEELQTLNFLPSVDAKPFSDDYWALFGLAVCRTFSFLEILKPHFVVSKRSL